MRFAVELVDRGLITAEQFVDAIRFQLSLQRPLGEIAVESGALSLCALVELLVRQTEVDRPLGELAIESGDIDHETLASLMLRQVEECPTVEQILVDRGAISATQLQQVTDQIRRELSSRVGSWYQDRYLCGNRQ